MPILEKIKIARIFFKRQDKHKAQLAESRQRNNYFYVNFKYRHAPPAIIILH